jgi:hypothetical protein
VYIDSDSKKTRRNFLPKIFELKVSRVTMDIADVAIFILLLPLSFILTGDKDINHFQTSTGSLHHVRERPTF